MWEVLVSARRCRLISLFVSLFMFILCLFSPTFKKERVWKSNLQHLRHSTSIELHSLNAHISISDRAGKRKERGRGPTLWHSYFEQHSKFLALKSDTQPQGIVSYAQLGHHPNVLLHFLPYKKTLSERTCKMMTVIRNWGLGYPTLPSGCFPFPPLPFPSPSREKQAVLFLLFQG